MASYIKIAVVAGIGIIVGLLICVLLFIFANKNHKVKTEYDERQKAIMGKSYTYGFWGMLITEVILMCLRLDPSSSFPVPNYLFHVIPMYLGLTVVSIYQIWKKSCFGLNNNHRRYIAIIIIAGIINVAITICAIVFADGRMVHGYYDLPYVNILCTIYLFVMGIAWLIRWCFDRDEKEE